MFRTQHKSDYTCDYKNIGLTLSCNLIIMSMHDQINSMKESLQETSEKFEDMASDAKLSLQAKYEELRKEYHKSRGRMSNDEKEKAHHELQELDALLSEKGYKGERIG